MSDIKKINQNDYREDNEKKNTETNENNAIDEEEIINMISKMSEDVEVPDSLSPENMMRRLDEMKATDKRFVRKGKKRTNQIYKGLFAGAAVVFAVCMAFVGKGIYDKSVTKDESSYIKKVIYDSEELGIGKGSYEVEHISDRDIVLSLVVNKSVGDYLDRKVRNRNSTYLFDSIIEDTSEDILDDEQFNDEIAYNSEANDSTKTVTFGADEEEAVSYYQNNDQVDGVKEADYVITDGKNIYTIRGREFVISSVNGENVENTSKTNYGKDVAMHFTEQLGISYEDSYIGHTFNEKLYVKGNKLILIFDYVNAFNYGYDYGDYYEDYYEDYSTYDVAYPYYGENQNSYVMIMQYDISDIYAPKLEDIHKIEGNIVSSRMVGDYLYVFTDRYIDTYISMNEKLSEEIDRIKDNSIPKIDDKEIPCENIYLTDKRIEGFNYQITAAFKVSQDGLILTDSMAVLSEYSDVYVNNEHIYTFSTMYVEDNDTGEDGYEVTTGKNQTKIYKFTYKDGDLQPYAVGIVDGEILNQFSLDEYNGYLRLVSTVTNTVNWWNTATTNALFILDDSLNTCGSIEGLAENERIYSARFSGDKAYFVTYRQMDPLFVADLSDVNNPVITDELEMTGNSDYLQKWNENTLLGVGVEATEFGVTTGIKIALYDVSDDWNLNEISKFVLEDWHDYNRYNYKNMMIAPEKAMFGMGIDDENYRSHYLVFRIQDGNIEIALDYTVEEYDDRYVYDYYMYTHTYRGLYIGDYIYIVTIDSGIAVVSMEDASVKGFVKFD